MLIFQNVCDQRFQLSVTLWLIFLNVTRVGATRRKADQSDTPSKRTRFTTNQSPETLTEHDTIVEQAESQAIEDRGFVNEFLLQVRSHVIIHANEHGSYALGTHASLLSEQPKQLVCGEVTSVLSSINAPADHLDQCTLNHELPSEVQQAQVGAVTQRTGEGSTTELDADQRENMRDAMT